MALIRNSIASQIAREAIVLDLGDLREQGEAMLRRAQAEAERIVAEARAERQRILEGAAESGKTDGFARGVEEGRVKGREEARAAALAEHGERLASVEIAWAEALGAFVEQREDLVQGATRDVIRLAAMIGERVTKRALALDPSIVADQLAAVLSVVVRPTELAVRIHPEDRAIVEQALPRLVASMPAIRHAEIVDDPSVERGGCVAMSRADAEKDDAGGGEIDARIGTQLDRIVEVLLPGTTDVEEPGNGSRA